MKNLLITLLMFGTLGSICAQSATTTVFVAIGLKDVECNSWNNYTMVGYSWWKGSDYGVISEKAKKDVRDNFPSSDRIVERSGYGKYLVIISSDVKTETCNRTFFGVGIGLNESECLSKAKKDMPFMWDENKYRYSTLVNRSVN